MNTEIPIEASTFEHVPESLKAFEGAPKFTFRYGTRRDRHKFQQELSRRGLNNHSDDEIRLAVLAEMKRLSQNTPEAIERMTDAAERYWAAMDALGKGVDAWLKECTDLKAENPEIKENEYPAVPTLDFDAEEAAWISNVITKVSADSALIGNMRADNTRRDFEMKEIALASTLVSVEGFELVRRHDKMIEAQSLIDLEEWLGDKAEALGLEEIESGLPYDEIRRVAEASFWLPKVAEKNFASPPLTTSSQSGLTSPETTTPSISKASAQSQNIQEASSVTQTSESSTSPCPVETDGETSLGLTDAG